MKQKKINNILYVMEKTPYKITKDLPADYIYVDAYTFPGFKELNPELNLSPYNYNMLVIQIPEYYPYIDIPDTEIGKVSFDTSEENLVVITRGTVNDPPVGAEIKTYYTITKDGESTTDFFTTETFDLEIIEDYDGATLTAWTTAGDFEGETDETTLVFVKDYSSEYLTFVALEDGTFTFTPQNSNVISYKKNNGEWSTGNTVEVLTGDEVQWKGEMTPNTSGIGTFGSTGTFDAQGNIMSLLYGDNFIEQTSLNNKQNIFKMLFSGNTHLINAENLILPATQLTSNCYDSMFSDCTGLITGPLLPATILANSCYYCMFKNTNVLPDTTNIDFTSQSVVASVGLRGLFAGTKVTDNDLNNILPKNSNNKYYLPSTTLAYNCYSTMFQGCTSLTTAPELPATTLGNYCYDFMFKGCTSLTTAPELPATTLGDYCYRQMFSGCTNLTTAPELPATTLKSSCYEGMFSGCTSLTTAPVLPATTAGGSIQQVYKQMFQNCTNLNYIKAMFTFAPNSNWRCDNWVQNVSPTGTFVKNAAATWDVTGNNGIPTGWTVETATE